MNTTEISPSWWKRNWKWALPTGGCLTIIIIAFSLIGYGVYKVSSTLSKDNSVMTFLEVILEVQKNEEIAAALGKPIDIKESDYDPKEIEDVMNLDIELHGNKNNGLLKVRAQKTEEGWHYELFTVTVENTGEIIDLTTKMNE